MQADISLKNCTACGHTPGNPLITIPNYPCVEGILYPENPFKNHKCDINIAVCDNCGTIYNLTRPPVAFLEDNYFRYYSPIIQENTSMGKYRQELFNCAFEYAGKTKGSVYQDSCQDGTLLHRFRDAGWTVAGNELDIHGELARKQGMDIKRTNLRDAIINEKYDLFLSAHVIEHMDDVTLYLKKIASLLNENGKVVIQSPGFEDRLDAYGVFQWISCHASYFSEATRRGVFARCGFEIDEILHQMNGTQTVLARYTGRTSDYRADPALEREMLGKYDKKEKSLLTKLTDLLIEHIGEKDRLLFYGAGQALTNILFYNPYLLKHEHVIVDISQHKHGQRIQLSPQPVSSPESAVDFKPDTVIVASPGFQQEILEVCKQLYTPTKAVTLMPEPSITSLN